MKPMPVLLGLAFVLMLGLPSASASDFEVAPVRTATQVLGAAKVKGEGYTIRERVDPRGFLNHYEVESMFGRYRPASDRMLEVRLREIATMQRLLTMDRTSTFFKSLKGRLVDLPTSLVEVGTNPVGAVRNVPKAVEKTFGRVGSFLGGIGKSSGGGGPDLSPDAIRDSLVASQKRKLAAELKVDVYSSNSKLQQMLEDVATARYAGELSISLASYAIPTTAGSVVYSTASTNKDIVSMLADKNEDELVAHNAKALRDMGVHAFVVRKFFEAPALTPRHESLIVQAMRGLRGVRGLGAIPEAATEATSEERALLQEEQAIALAAYHQKREPLAALEAAGGIVMARTRSGRGVIVAPIDIVWHEAGAEKILRTLAAEPFFRGVRAKDIEIKGRVTQRLVDRAKALGFRVISGWPGLR